MEALVQWVLEVLMEEVQVLVLDLDQVGVQVPEVEADHLVL